MGGFLAKPSTTVFVESGNSTSHGLVFAVGEMQGWRRSMEDAHVAVPDVNVMLIQSDSSSHQKTDASVDSNGSANSDSGENCIVNGAGEHMALFAVFDGHGGKEVAKFAQQKYAQEFVNLPEFRCGHYEEALRRSFHRIDELLEDIQYDDVLKELRALPNPSDTVDADIVGSKTQVAASTSAAVAAASSSTNKAGSPLNKLEVVAKLLKTLTIKNARAMDDQDVNAKTSSPEKSSAFFADDNWSEEDLVKRYMVDQPPLTLDSRPLYPSPEKPSHPFQSSQEVILLSDSEQISSDINQRSDTIDISSNNLFRHRSTVNDNVSGDISTKLLELSIDSSTEIPDLAPSGKVPITDKGEIVVKSGSPNSRQVSTNAKDSPTFVKPRKRVPVENGKLGRKAFELKAHRIPAGCTAIVAFKAGKQLYVANAGDSRAVLCRGDGQALALSEDHKPLQERELTRIMNAGGFVTKEGRVNGNLNLSRSLGDLKYKQSSNLGKESQIITAEPDVKVVDLLEDDRFIILACDGVWDCMSNQEACDFVSTKLSEGLSETEIVKQACAYCLAKPNQTMMGLGTDNMTFLLVKLR